MQNEEIEQMIMDGGYIEVVDIERRWIPSQVLKHLCGRKYNNDESIGLDSRAQKAKYAINVVADELGRQASIKNKAELDMREKFYNINLAKKMFDYFVKEMKEEFNNLKSKIVINRFDINSDFNETYKIILPGHYKYKDGRTSNGVFYSDCSGDEFINELMASSNVNSIIDEFKSADDSDKKAFAAKFRKLEALVCDNTKLPDIFVNVYKATGGYYTLRHLIRFENFFFYDESQGKLIDREASLKAIDEIVNALDIQHNGSEFIDILKIQLEKNSFNYENTVKAWAEEKEQRLKK